VRPGLVLEGLGKREIDRHEEGPATEPRPLVGVLRFVPEDAVVHAVVRDVDAADCGATLPIAAVCSRADERRSGAVVAATRPVNEGIGETHRGGRNVYDVPDELPPVDAECAGQVVVVDGVLPYVVICVGAAAGDGVGLEELLQRVGSPRTPPPAARSGCGSRAQKYENQQ